MSVASATTTAPAAAVGTSKTTFRYSAVPSAMTAGMNAIAAHIRAKVAKLTGPARTARRPL